MDPIATVTQLAAATGRTFDSVRAGTALDRASADIRSYCGWNITAEDGLSKTVEFGVGRRLIMLPSLHVRDVTSVTVDGNVLVADDDYTWSESGMVRVCRPSTARWGFVKATVVFDSGYPEVPEELVGVCCNLALGELKEPSAEKRSVRLGSMQIDYATGEATTSADTKIVDRYRILRSR